MKAAIIRLSSFYNYSDPNHPAFSVKNYQLDENTTKAMAMTIPYMIGYTDLELFNNNLTDMTATAIIMAFFANPTMNRLSIAYNHLRMTFVSTFTQLIKLFPNKILQLNVMGSIAFPDHTEPITKSLSILESLNILNLAGCGMTHRTCRQLGRLIENSRTLSTLDVSHCKINY